MFLIELLRSEAGSEPTNGWLWPRFWRIMYIIWQVCAVVFVQIAFWVFFVTYYRVANYALEPIWFLKWMVLPIVVLPIVLVLTCIWNRIAYEGVMLLFRLFESQRETRTELCAATSELQKLNASALQNGNVQMKALQYMCDRLAQICDNTEKE